MAIPESGFDTRLGLAMQSAFGTAVADGAAVTQLYAEPTDIDKDIQVRVHEGNYATRQMIAAQQAHDTIGAMPTLSVSGDVDLNTIDLILYMLYQAVVEGASTPYSKVLTFPATQPDFSANAGAYATLIHRLPSASNSQKMLDVICKKLTLSLAAGERLKFAADLIGRGAVTATANPSGTWTLGTFRGLHRENLTRGTFDVGGGAQAVHLESAEIVLDVEHKKIGQVAPKFGQHGLLRRTGSIKLSAVYEAAKYQLLNTAAEAGTLTSVNLGWGNATPGTVDGDFDITATMKIDSVRIPSQALQTMEVSGTLLAINSSGQMCTITMANAVDRGW